MEDGTGFVRSFMMNPHAVNVTQHRDIDRVQHKPKGPAFLTIRGEIQGAQNEPK